MWKVKQISKRFGGVIALDNVSLAFKSGKVNAVIGENGAGKSTLMNILSGVYQDYRGEIIRDEETVFFSNPAEAQHAGIATIYQELNLVPHLNVTENIFLGKELLNAVGLLDRASMFAEAKSLLDRLRLNIQPDTLVSTLKVGQQQLVEIAKALRSNADVIIMDEPSSAISDNEVQMLFGIISDLRAQGKTIIYISHKLDELFRIADTYYVLRDGHFIGSGWMKDTNEDEIIRKMVGREILFLDKAYVKDRNNPVMSVRELSVKHPSNESSFCLKNISFDLYGGEILGIYGLMGAGRTELLEALFGLHPQMTSGNIMVNDSTVVFNSVGDAINAGLALIPEDRKTEGLVHGMSIRANLTMPFLKQLSSFGFIRKADERSITAKYLSFLQIKASSPEQLAGHLSGGNQQKLVLAKWLATKPRILLLDEPTRGVDVAAKNDIYQLILDVAKQGLAIILVSSEIAEVMAVSDRIMTMTEGRVTGTFLAAETTEDELLKSAIPRSIT